MHDLVQSRPGKGIEHGLDGFQRILFKQPAINKLPLYCLHILKLIAVTYPTSCQFGLQTQVCIPAFRQLALNNPSPYSICVGLRLAPNLTYRDY